MLGVSIAQQGQSDVSECRDRCRDFEDDLNVVGTCSAPATITVQNATLYDQVSYY